MRPLTLSICLTLCPLVGCGGGSSGLELDGGDGGSPDSAASPPDATIDTSAGSADSGSIDTSVGSIDTSVDPVDSGSIDTSVDPADSGTPWLSDASWELRTTPRSTTPDVCGFGRNEAHRARTRSGPTGWLSIGRTGCRKGG
jgi:hypothetical protein